MKHAILLLMLIFLPGLAKSQNLIKFPYIQKRVCPFECCRFGKWTAKSALDVYANEGDTTKVKFTISAGDSFLAVSGNVHIMKPGIVIVTKPVYSFSAGDTLYTLSYYGEGSIDVWHRGKLENIDMFWGTPSSGSPVNVKDAKWSKFSGVLTSRGLMIWWVNISSRDGRTGWLRLVNTSDNGFALDEEIDGMDECN
jgi:hypothetical protein